MELQEISEPTECRLVVARMDITGFAKACKGKPEMDIFNTLDQYYNLVVGVVSAAGGKVVKFAGDCSYIVFSVDHAREGVSALEEAKAKTQPVWEEFDQSCRVMISAHVGRVIAGPIGPGRTFDVIGNTVNDMFRMPLKGPDRSDDLEAIL